jgi:Mn2+/Fe2+ NRAMP family transporter
VNKQFRDAPIFYWLYTFLIAAGAGLVLLPNFPLVKMILLSQVLNGVLLPVILIFMVLLVNRTQLMGKWTNTPVYNTIAWSSVAILVGLTLALVGITVRQMTS